MNRAYLPGASLLGVVVLAILAWVLLGSPGPTGAQTKCEGSDPPESYDIVLVGTVKLEEGVSEQKLEMRVNGKMVHMKESDHLNDVLHEWQVFYDGDVTVYRSIHPESPMFEIIKVDDPSLRDVGSHEFPFGRDHLCVQLEAMGAEYVETDDVGKKYTVEQEKSYDTIWVDDDGWLVQAERQETLFDGTTTVTISGLGEHNEITLPGPPYFNLDQ